MRRVSSLKEFTARTNSPEDSNNLRVLKIIFEQMDKYNNLNGVKENIQNLASGNVKSKLEDIEEEISDVIWDMIEQCRKAKKNIQKANTKDGFNASSAKRIFEDMEFELHANDVLGCLKLIQKLDDFKVLDFAKEYDAEVKKIQKYNSIYTKLVRKLLDFTKSEVRNLK